MKVAWTQKDEELLSRDQFFLVGLSPYSELQLFLFVLWLSMFVITLLGNSLLIIISSLDSHLPTPMWMWIKDATILVSCMVASFIPTSHSYTSVIYHHPSPQCSAYLGLRENPALPVAVLCRWLSLLVWAPLSVYSWVWWPMTSMWPSVTH